MAHFKTIYGDVIVINQEQYDVLDRRVRRTSGWYHLKNGESVRIESLAFLSPFNPTPKRAPAKRKKKKAVRKPAKVEINEAIIETGKIGEAEESS